MCPFYPCCCCCRRDCDLLAVVVAAAAPPSGRLRQFYRSVRAPHDETQAPGVIHRWYQLHPKTSSVKGVDPDTSSDSEISSLTSSVPPSVPRPVPQPVQKPKKKRESKAFKAAVAVAAVVSSESSVLELAAPEPSAPEPSVPETIPYSVNCQLLYETSSVHGEVLQCVNDDLTSGLDLELLSFRQKTRAKSWADGKGLACFRVSVTASVTWANMKEEERFVTYLTLSDTWQEVASTVRAKFNAGKKNLGVHLVYQYGRAQNGEIPVEPAPAVAAKAPATQTARLEKERVEREGLRGSEHNRAKMLMKELLCHDRTCKNKGNQC